MFWAPGNNFTIFPISGVLKLDFDDFTAHTKFTK